MLEIVWYACNEPAAGENFEISTFFVKILHENVQIHVSAIHFFVLDPCKKGVHKTSGGGTPENFGGYARGVKNVGGTPENPQPQIQPCVTSSYPWTVSGESLLLRKRRKPLTFKLKWIWAFSQLFGGFFQNSSFGMKDDSLYSLTIFRPAFKEMRWFEH